MVLPTAVAVRPAGESAPPYGEGALPVLPALRALLPDGGLRRGSVVAVDALGALPLALAAGASAAGAWTAVVGQPGCGVLAAAELGVDQRRLLLVDEPGQRWPEVVAALLDGVELVLVRPVERPAVGVVRRLVALARRCGSVLVVAGPWEGAAVRLRIASSSWLGLGGGHGHLRARRVEVVATGRAGAARPRTVRLWLPGPDGAVTEDTTPRLSLVPGSASDRTAQETARFGQKEPIVVEEGVA